MATIFKELLENQSPEFRERVRSQVQQIEDDENSEDPLKRFPRGFLYIMHRDEDDGDYVLQSQDDPEFIVRGATPNEAVIAMERVYANMDLSKAD